MTKILLVADMEGIGGISSWSQCLPPQPRWHSSGRELYTIEIKTAVEALLETFDEVYIVDGHCSSNNIIKDEFKGMPVKIFDYLNLYAETMIPFRCTKVDALALIGAHGMTSTGNIFSHAISDSNKFIYIDGVLVGEVGLNMLGAASYGIPIIAVTGDEPACEEAIRLTNGAIDTYSTKTYTGPKPSKPILKPASEIDRNISETFRNAGKHFKENGGFLYPVKECVFEIVSKTPKDFITEGFTKDGGKLRKIFETPMQGYIEMTHIIGGLCKRDKRFEDIMKEVL